MLELKVNHTNLDLFPNTSIPLELNSPVFSSVGELAKSFSYSFRLPKTDVNQIALGFPDEIDSDQDQATIIAEVYFNGLEIVSGDLVISDASHEAYEVNLQVNRKIDWMRKPIRELEGVGGFFLRNNPRKIGFHIAFPFVFATTNKTLAVKVNGIEFSVSGAISSSALSQNLANSINNHAGINCQVTFTERNTVSLLMFEAVNTIDPFEVKPIYTPNVTWAPAFEDVNQYSAEATNTINGITNGNHENSTKVCFPQLLMPNVGTNADNTSNEAFKIINHHNGQLHVTARIMIPQPFLKFILEQIAETFGWQINLDIDPDLEKLILVNNNFSGDKNPNLSYGRLFYGSYYDYVELCPAGLTYFKLLEILEGFNLVVNLDFEAQIISIKQTDQTLKNNSQEGYEISEAYTVAAYEEDGYQINMLDGTKYAGGENEPEYQSYLNGENDIDIGFTFLPNQDNIPYFDLDIRHVDWLHDIKVFINGAQQPYLNKTPDITDPIFLFYHGKVEGKPTASRNADGWDLTTKGIYDKFWKNWIDFLSQAKVVNRTIYMTATQLKAFDFEKPIRLAGINFLVKQLRTVIAARHDERLPFAVECELLKI